jgi:hypothetical protein
MSSGNPPLGNYHFLAWARRGIGASASNVDNGPLPNRASLNVQLFLQVQGGTQPNPQSAPPVTVELFGPGDVVGVDARMAIRTEPRQSTVNFEPNYLCGIDFDTPDFPWLFTPAAPNGDRLHPWVALIVLKLDTEFKVPSVVPNPLPVVDVLKISALQDLSVSWNFAHVQISGDASLSDNLASAPGNVISRLLCPRRLDPETSYSAFLVPAFQNGVQIGLGKDISAITTSDPAWTNASQAPLRLPFFYRLDFHTSDAGDFESLVRALTPTVLPPAVGTRPMDVSQPDPGVPSAGPPLGLEGALESVGSQPTTWNDPDKTAFQTAVQTWINQTSASTIDLNNPGPDPEVNPPIYGRWHAAVQSVDRTAQGWVNDLNLDPRNRSGAGMGTQVVQLERTALMASAWQQVAGVLEANQMLKQAQLARAATQQIYRQHFLTAQSETLLNFTTPLHARLLASPSTVKAAVRGSRVPERMLSGSFRKIARLPAHLRMAKTGAPTLLSRVSSGDVKIVPDPKPPGGMVSLDTVASQSAPAWAEALLKWWKKWSKWIIVGLIVLLIVVAVVVGIVAGLAAALGVVVAIVGVLAAARLALKNILATAAAGNEVQFSNFTPQAIAQVPPASNFQITAPVVPLAGGRGSGPADSAQAAAFRSATSQVFGAYQALPANPGPLPALDINGLRTTIVSRIDPALTVPRRVQGLVSISSRLPWAPLDPLQPVMAYPEFPQAMYAPLRDLSEAYLLPGVDQVLPNSLGLLQVNRRLIEAYMVGLNHEMARQLLWSGYPTDQRGSYFRQFWDVRAYVRQKNDPTDPNQLHELLKDIPPVNTWPLTNSLGSNPNRTDIVANNLVLLVRGELFKRYPYPTSVSVYAGKAKRDPKGDRVLDDTDERYPIFGGSLSPDMTFLGFNLSADDARGGTATSPDGFFFVFQQHPTEPRFGLEPTADASPVPHWAELAWTNFAIPDTAAHKALAPKNAALSLPINNVSQSSLIANSPWRMASRVFGLVQTMVKLPDFLSPNQQPSDVAIAAGGGDPSRPDYTPTDPNNQWGVNSAQTAYILFRLPFRVLIHADLMLPK